MKKFFRLAIVIVLFMGTINSSYAISTSKIDKLINKSKLNETSTIAISIKNVENNNIVYEKDSKKLLHPASTLKIFSTYAALDTLGYEYLFKTQFYKDSENNLYVKLGADPLLTSGQIKQALKKIKSEVRDSFNNLYIDDSIIDKKEFAPGWMWDDDVNSYTPKVSAYNLDGNLLRMTLSPMQNGNMEAVLKTKYPTAVYTYVTNNDKSNFYEVTRYNWNNPELIEIYGNISSLNSINVPISSMRRYFIKSLENNLKDAKISIKSTAYASKLVPENAELIGEINNPIKGVLGDILQNSNNLMSVSICKLAASKKYNSTGSEDLAVELFKEFYNQNGIETDSIYIKDGSGVSRKNLLSADWITTALNKLYKMDDFNKFKEYMAQPGDGTLSLRLYDLRGEAWLKTGSLSNISAVSGYVKSQDGNMYSVSIMIQNFTQNQQDIKSFEDEIIKLIYSR